ncbi:MAG TPA: helix-turn-helix domain-containing protein [Candidatus Kapabacteria bacterium]|nr:helix-turn-helix domain-containing protein [Candidatus Kapabacteria bacterium]
MPRRRDAVITESSEKLQRLESEYRGKPEGQRLATLRLLRERPDRPIEEIATMVGFSAATVKRWLRAYREGGLAAVLDRRAGGKDGQRFDAGLSTLKQKLLNGDLSNLEEAYAWIADYRRSPGTRKIAQQAIHRARPSGAAAQESPGEEADGAANAEAMRQLFVDRLTAAVVKESERVDIGAFADWLRGVNGAIAGVFDDVDLAHFIPNVNVNLWNPSDYRPTIVMANGGDSEPLMAPISREEWNNDAFHIQRMLKQLADHRFKADRYHPPKAFVYYYCDTAYLGTLLLWRELGKPPISRQTLEILDSLAPTLKFVLIDLVARHMAVWPHMHTPTETASHLARSFQLTPQETRILVLQFVGRSYEQIAEILNISLNTVRTHVKSIYAKSGTHGHSDFTARYLTPLADIEAGNGGVHSPGRIRRGTPKTQE